MLNRFPGKSRRKAYDPEDAFSDVTLEVYQEALNGDLKAPPEKHDWRTFLHERMRNKYWLQKRRDSRNLTADEGGEALKNVEAGENDDPTRPVETREELGVLMSKVKDLLTPKQNLVFCAMAQELAYKEIAQVARTTPGAARVHLSNAEKKLNKKLRRKKKVA